VCGIIFVVVIEALIGAKMHTASNNRMHKTPALLNRCCHHDYIFRDDEMNSNFMPN